MMDPKMDDKALKLKSLLDLMQEMKMEDSKSLPGKPKVTEISIHAAKMPGKPMDGQAEMGMEPAEESMEDPRHEAMESPEFEKGEDEGEMESEQHPEDQDLMSKLPPALQEMLKEHLRKKM